MQSVMRVVVQSQVDECLVRCVATPGGQETNSGINTRTSVCQSLCLSVCLSASHFFLLVLLPGLPTPECAEAGLKELVLFYGLDSYQ